MAEPALKLVQGEAANAIGASGVSGGRGWSPKVVLGNRVVDGLWLAGLSNAAGVVWAVLYRHADAQTLAVRRVSNERLADEAGVSGATVKRVKGELTAAGLLAVERRGGAGVRRACIGWRCRAAWRVEMTTIDPPPGLDPRDTERRSVYWAHG